MSIRISWYVPSAAFSSISTHSTPSFARSTAQPSSCSSSAAISALRSLSSVSKIFVPDRLFLSEEVVSRFACVSSCDAMRQGMVTINVEPTPILLSTSTVPPISPTSFFTMPIPMPLPSTLLTVEVRSRSNGSKMCFRNSCDIPMPLSATVITASHQPSFRRASA